MSVFRTPKQRGHDPIRRRTTDKRAGEIVFLGDSIATSAVRDPSGLRMTETHLRNRMAGTGFELPAKTSGKPHSPVESSAESGAVGAHLVPIDADLRAIIDAWPTLSESTKAEIRAIVTHSSSVADNGT